MKYRSASASKPASFSSLFMRFHLLVPALMIPVGIGILAFSEGMAEQATRFSEDGIETQARVLRGRTDVTHDGRFVYMLEFAYEVDDIAYTGAVSTTKWSQGIAERRGTLKIRYSSRDPAVYEVTGRSMIELWSVRGAGLLLLFAGGYWLWTGLTRIRGLVWLNANGKRSRAVVTDHYETGWKSGGYYKLMWQEPDGSEARSLTHSRHRLRAYPKGTEIDVIRDPAGRIKSAWSGDLEIWP